MKITIESTTRVVEVKVNGISYQARAWEGETESGVKVHCLIPRIAAHKDADLSQFERELQEQKAPSDATMQCFPLRMIL